MDPVILPTAGVETPVLGYAIAGIVVPLRGVVIPPGGLGSNLQYEVRRLALLLNGVTCNYSD